MDTVARIQVTNRRKPGWWRVLLRLIAPLVLIVCNAIPAAYLLVNVHFARDLPELVSFDELDTSTVNRFHAADGLLVGEWSRERRLAVGWEQFPPLVIKAFLAAEDARFFSHSGVDYYGVARALWTNLRGGEIAGQVEIEGRHRDVADRQSFEIGNIDGVAADLDGEL